MTKSITALQQRLTIPSAEDLGKNPKCRICWRDFDDVNQNQAELPSYFRDATFEYLENQAFAKVRIPRFSLLLHISLETDDADCRFL